MGTGGINMKHSITVENIKCGGCANSIKRGILFNKNIHDVHIDVETGKITFESEKEIDVASIKKDLLKLGYPEKGSKNSVISKAKSYVSCAIGRIGNKE